MVLMFIVYSNAVDEEIVEAVNRHAPGYTKFLGVHGEGNGDPHLGSHVWPGVNNCVMVAAENKAVDAISRDVAALKETFPGIGINIMVAQLKKMI